MAYTKARISDAEVQRYYAENKLFFDKVIVRASHILLKVTPESLIAIDLGQGPWCTTRSNVT